MCTKKEQFSAKWQKNLELKKRNYHDDSEKKQPVKRRYKNKKECTKQYENNLKNRTSHTAYKKAKSW